MLERRKESPPAGHPTRALTLAAGLSLAAFLGASAAVLWRADR